MSYCVQCDRIDTDAEASYCYRCGDKLLDDLKCHVCERELLIGIDNFCPVCGTKVTHKGVTT